MAIEILPTTTGNVYEDVINKVYNAVRELALRYDVQVFSGPLTADDPVTIDEDHQPSPRCPIRLTVTRSAPPRVAMTINIKGTSMDGSTVESDVVFAAEAADNVDVLTTIEFFSSITSVESNVDTTVTIVNDPGQGGRDASLSDECVHNIELNPVIIPITADRRGMPVPSINISMDSSQSANDLVGELQAIVELLNIRIELYLGRINSGSSLTIKSTQLINDLRYVLSPTRFIGAPMSKPLSMGAHYDATEFSEWRDGATALRADNPFGVQQWLASRPSVRDTQPPVSKIMNAGIVQWGFDERTRQTTDELLVFIFSVELHHYVENVLTTD